MRSVLWLTRPALSVLHAGGFVQRVGDGGDAVSGIVLVAFYRVVARVDHRRRPAHRVVICACLLLESVDGLGHLVDGVVFDAGVKAQRVGNPDGTPHVVGLQQGFVAQRVAGFNHVARGIVVEGGGAVAGRGDGFVKRIV